MTNPRNLNKIRVYLRRVALICALIVAIAPPAIVGYVGFNQAMSELDFRSQVVGNNLAEFINTQGSTWEYSFHRLPELIELGDPDGIYFSRIGKLADNKEAHVYDMGPDVGKLTLTSRAIVSVRGDEVATVLLSASATGLIYALASVAAGSFLLAIALFTVFNRLPMRILRETIGELELSQASLAEEVTQKNIEAKRAHQASEVKSNFLAHMSHEMRTPLNAIIGFSELMTHEVFGALNQAYADYAVDINKSGKHLLHLVNSVLDLSKVEQNKLDLHYSEIEMRGVISEAISLVREEARVKQISVSALIDNDLPNTMISDHAKIYQTLINIVTNAIKYTPVGGRVTISARPLDDDIEVAVEDNGIGMSSENIRRALEPFGQIKNAFTANTSGTGLGLTIASSFVESLGGTLKISSEVNKGTRVTLRIPYISSDDIDYEADLLKHKNADQYMI